MHKWDWFQCPPARASLGHVYWLQESCRCLCRSLNRGRNKKKKKKRSLKLPLQSGAELTRFWVVIQQEDCSRALQIWCERRKNSVFWNNLQHSFVFFFLWESINEQPSGDAPFVPTLRNNLWIEVQTSIFLPPLISATLEMQRVLIPSRGVFFFFYGGFKHNSLAMELYLYK